MPKSSRRAEQNQNRFHEQTILLEDQAIDHRNARRYPEALRAYAEVMRRYQAMDYGHRVRELHTTMGDIYADQGRYQEAVRMHERGYRLCTADGDVLGSARAANAVGCDLQNLGAYGDAIEWHAAAESLYLGWHEYDRARVATQNRVIAEQRAGL